MLSRLFAERASFRLPNNQSCRRLSVCAPLELWQIDLTVLDNSTLDMLSPRELERAGRLRFDRDRRRYLAAHVALRRLLAIYSGVAPAAQIFEAGEHGKPQLVDQPRLGFNLSYAGDTAIIGIAEGAAIGVDVGVPDEIIDFDGVLSTVFTPAERAACNAAPVGLPRQRLFMAVWTRKEACLKALGTGLSVDPSTFEAGTDGVRPIAIGSNLNGPVLVGSFEVGLCKGAWARAVGMPNSGDPPTPVR